MLSSVAFVFSSLLATALCNYTFPEGFNIGLVSPQERNSWCLAQRNSCPQICGGVATTNYCDSVSLSIYPSLSDTTLDFNCVCSNGSQADVTPYAQTIPSLVCQNNYGQCVANHPNDLDGQKKCKDDAQCGTLNASDATAAATTTAGSAASSSAATTLSTSSASATLNPSASKTSAAVASSTSTGAASAIRIAQDYSTAVLMTALFAVFRLAL
ncbi:hypothetical protein MPDQ_002828 [Monascus purpureus]|uniref:DUF7707 domain-containing protein n=1 Tax=Monascus purpureus TaxID=5098 RepID=A0A507QJX4_MONPU|nr:hypothetical protein MPDQ_002828 [Monascus purpureus]